MVNSNMNTLGIIFPNSYDTFVPDLVNVRLMASIPFASRYRLIDFVLSSMVNSGINSVSVLVREKYHSLMDHLGSGREWDLVRKNGGLTIWPPYAEKGMNLYGGRIEALDHTLDYLRKQKEKYVIMADTNVAVNFDFRKLVATHEANDADVTVAYTVEEIPEGSLKAENAKRGMYYTFDFDESGRVSKWHINTKEKGVHNLGMNIYCFNREYLINLIDDAFIRGNIYLERDILAKEVDKIKIYGHKYIGYCSRICDMKSYFQENMKLLEDENLEGLFAGGPIYTKLRDDNPTRYINGAAVKNTMAADGCVIEGTVENCILFRGVKIGKGAVVKNCVLMQDTVVESGVKAEYIITDKNAVITSGKELKGADSFPIYIAKHQVV